MPGATVEALAAPIRRLQTLVGPGFSGDPSADPASALRGVRQMLDDIAGSSGQAWRTVEAGWAGAGADAAADFAASTSRAIGDAAQRASTLGVAAEDAAAAVARAHQRLQAIVDEFEAKATALEPHLDSPGVARELLTAARNALADAIRVVEELQGELDRQARVVDATSPGAAPATTVPASSVPASAAGYGPGGAAPGAGLGGAGMPAGLGGFGDTGAVGEMAAFTRPDGTEVADAAEFGEGVAVRLPDGTVVTAPNPVAADAVRHALTQLGVPYQWGGTTPGVGLDCSGLTQWAYQEAGLGLPRLAQEQDVGASVAGNAVLPGDLAVWDGHVAMVVGDGLMVEAGDPVKLSPIRTVNAGQGFQGFWRPTA
ncbi:C40 family peptidase [Mycolicibacterium parafortuitum]|uniref:C40 family peptidase n=1 Tax=Mycolicibacterium parafortuitum TaxID=39692 RepID=UPI0009F1FB02|nr:C40 family peptidase [Mycolicibacterium parafortuitum]ORB25038.1 glycoside hydrolase [Mycolicibacterium parafortuitum]